MNPYWQQMMAANLGAGMMGAPAAPQGLPIGLQANAVPQDQLLPIGMRAEDTPAAAPGFDYMRALAMADGMLNQPQQEQAPQLQAPGLLMPNIQIQPYQPPPLTAMGGLFGGGR